MVNHETNVTPLLCTIPIYIPNSSGPFRHLGSGVILFFKQRHYLATAAHVIDGDGLTCDRMICTSRQESFLVPLSKISKSTKVPAPVSQDREPYDLAVVPLPEGDAKNLASLGLHSIRCDDLALPAVKPGDELAFVGYPKSEQKFCPLADGTWIEQHPVSIRVFQVSESEAASLGFPLKTHIVGRFRHPESPKSTNESSVPLLPPGMSGGVVWHFSREGIMFAGVVTTWNQKGHVIGTRSHLLLPLLEAMSNAV